MTLVVLLNIFSPFLIIGEHNFIKNVFFPENSFYLKRRSEPQPTIPSFPPQAWTVTESESPTAKPVEKPVDNHVPETANNQTQKNGDDLLQDGGLRGILKKQRDSRQGVARSNSSPNIRDSLEVTKQHMKGSRSTQSTPDVCCFISPVGNGLFPHLKISSRLL